MRRAESGEPAEVARNSEASILDSDRHFAPTHGKYVIVELNVFEQLGKPLPYDDSDPDPRDFYGAFRDAVKDDLDAPGMEAYDNYKPRGEGK